MGGESPDAGQVGTLPDYLRSEFIGGIPSSVLAQPGSGHIPAASGRDVHYNVQHHSILFSDYTDDGGEVSFSADVRTETMPSGVDEPCIVMDIYTRQPDGSYHPDFRAEPLFHAAVDYLNQEQPVPHFVGKWNEEGDNTAQYRANLSRFGDAPTQEQQLAAANGTWTGRMANANGYFAEAVSTDGYNYKAVFTRDAPNHAMPVDGAGEPS
jgi:hypothetical protein